MRLHTIRVPCNDPVEAAKFYTSLLGQDSSFGDAEAGFIGFVLENVTLLLEHSEPGEYESGGYRGFSLEVEDIHSFYELHQERVKFTGPPEQQIWGGMMTHVEDGDGNVFSIVEMRADA